MSRQTELQNQIQSLHQAIPELRGALVASTDGLSIAHALGAGIDADRVAAMAATALGVGKRIADTLGAGVFAETSVRGQDGQIFLYAAGPQAMLAVIAPEPCNVGLVHLEARAIAQQIATTMGGGQ